MQICINGLIFSQLKKPDVTHPYRSKCCPCGHKDWTKKEQQPRCPEAGYLVYCPLKYRENPREKSIFYFVAMKALEVGTISLVTRGAVAAVALADYTNTFWDVFAMTPLTGLATLYLKY